MNWSYLLRLEMVFTVQMRQALTKWTLSLALEVGQQLLGVHTARDKPCALASHRAEHALSALVDKRHIRKINHAASAVRFETRVFPVRLELGNPGPGQLAAQNPS